MALCDILLKLNEIAVANGNVFLEDLTYILYYAAGC